MRDWKIRDGLSRSLDIYIDTNPKRHFMLDRVNFECHHYSQLIVHEINNHPLSAEKIRKQMRVMM